MAIEEAKSGGGAEGGVEGRDGVLLGKTEVMRRSCFFFFLPK